MKKILIYVTPERVPSLFDLVVAYDSGADIVIPYGNIIPEDTKDIVYGCVFTRKSEHLKNTAIFIGGHDVVRSEELLSSILAVFRQLPKNLRVSIVIDPDGAYTTASACVARVKKAIRTGITGMNVTVLAGTGPVGQKAAILMAKEGCNVTITSRSLEHAKSVCSSIKERYNIKISPAEVRDTTSLETVIQDSEIVISAGPEGVCILPMSLWSKFKKIRVMADVNAVPPYGIEGVDANSVKELNGKTLIGAISIGSLKMKCHREVVKKIFGCNDVVFDIDMVYGITCKFA